MDGGRRRTALGGGGAPRGAMGGGNPLIQITNLGSALSPRAPPRQRDGMLTLGKR